MKNLNCQLCFCLTACCGAVLGSAMAQDDGNRTNATEGTNAPSIGPREAGATSVPANDGLTLNFRGVPVETVLSYLSKAAGMTIIREADMEGIGNVDMVSERPVSAAEIVTLLNKVLADHDLAVLQEGKMLTIMTAEDAAMNSRTPVVVWNHDAGSIPQDSQVVTEVIPLHSLNATQVIKDLGSLLPRDALVGANEGGNAILMTARQADIRHFTQLLQALDGSGETDLEVYVLAHADAKAISDELKEIFTPQDTTANQGNPFPNFLGNNGGRAAGGNAASENPKRAAIRVNTVSDDQNNAVLVSAPSDVMPAISNLIQKLDIAQDDLVEIRVFPLQHADPSDVASQLSSLFPDPSAQGNQQNNLRGFGPQFVGSRALASSATEPSERMKKQTTVMTVADARTQSVLVTASKETMKQIANMIAELDSSDKGTMHVYIYQPQYADAADLEGPLRDLFASTAQIASSTEVNALTQRANQFAQNGGTSSSSSGSTVNVGGSSGGK